jgi:aspartate racemase
MKTLGIVGGIGPESTIDYYRSLITRYRERAPDGGYPPLLINSIDVSRVLALVGAGERALLTEYLTGAVQQLERGGADLGLIAANTPHIVFDEVARASRLPLISIVEATRAAAQHLGLRRLGLFGTRFTMTAPFYFELFARSAMEVLAPTPEEQDFIHRKYTEELIAGTFLSQTRESLVAIVESMRARAAIDGLILGGTELPLILQEARYGDVTVLNTTLIHVDAAIDRMLTDE